MLRYGEFDVAEMSTGSFLMSRDKGAPRLIGIPVFPSKTFRHSCIYINTDSGIKKPADMAGKRVGVPEYQITMATWARGILQHEYGVLPEQMKWFTGGEEHPGRQDKVKHNLPSNINIQPIPDDQTLSAMLASGEIDAMISAHYAVAVQAPPPQGSTVDCQFPRSGARLFSPHENFSDHAHDRDPRRNLREASLDCSKSV
jgi:4,5-dihydroxyphthalate decarboxylase